MYFLSYFLTNCKVIFFCNLSSYSNLSYKIHETFQLLVTLLKFSFNESLVSSRPQSYNFEGKRPPMRKPKDQLGGKYLVFLSRTLSLEPRSASRCSQRARNQRLKQQFNPNTGLWPAAGSCQFCKSCGGRWPVLLSWLQSGVGPGVS